MKKVKSASDVDERELGKGDVVATLSGNLTAKICDLAEDMDMEFVCLRAVQHPFSKGVWHAADQVQLIKKAPPPKVAAPAAAETGDGDAAGKAAPVSDGKK